MIPSAAFHGERGGLPANITATATRASRPANLPAFMAVALTARLAMPSRISSTQSRSLATTTSRASATTMPRAGSWMTCRSSDRWRQQAGGSGQVVGGRRGRWRWWRKEWQYNWVVAGRQGGQGSRPPRIFGESSGASGSKSAAGLPAHLQVVPAWVEQVLDVLQVNLNHRQRHLHTHRQTARQAGRAGPGAAAEKCERSRRSTHVAICFTAPHQSCPSDSQPASQPTLTSQPACSPASLPISP